MGKSLNLKIIAEGVETKEQKKFFEGTNCDYIQGYYYSKPLDYESLLDWLRHES